MKKTIKYSAIILFILALTMGLFSFIYISNIMKDSKDIVFDKSKLITSATKITLLDNNSQELETNSVLQQTVTLQELPAYVVDAFISIEDKRFFTHNGLDYKRIAKAMYNNVKNGAIVEGASTISQQLIKNTHLSNEKTINRKIKEMLLTKKLENNLSKKDILESYLNVIYFGEGNYGIEQASNYFFNKPAKDLTISESATLAGVIKSPATYSPIYHKDSCISRRNLVINQMYNNNKITLTQQQEALDQELIVASHNNTTNPNSLYLKAVISEASSILNLSEKDTASSGYVIKTYLDTQAQKTLEDTINDESFYHVNTYGNVADSLAIIIDNETSGIKALAGKSQYNLLNFNRQPGSAIKPILVYAPALEDGLIQPSTLILDEPIDYNGYKPNNVGHIFHDQVSVTTSLSKSLNIPAVKVLDYYGIEKAKDFASNAGITFDDNDNGLAIALGGFTQGITLQQLTNSYLPFSNKGYYKQSKFIDQILDADGNVVYNNTTPTTKVMGDDTAYLMTDMLIDGVKNGTSKKLKSLPYQIAGKTGTVSIPGTNNNTDVYSVAYTSKDTMGVWLGNYTNLKEYELEGSNNGGTYATQMIKNTFNNLYNDSTPQDFVVPSSVIELPINLIDYEDNNKITIATEDTPERFVKNALFSTRYSPDNLSTVFTNYGVKNFEVKYSSNKADISFDASNYLKYELYRQVDNHSTLLLTSQDATKTIEYTDNSLPLDAMVSYYIKIINTYNDSYKKSEVITILTDSKDNIINQNIDKLENKKQNNDTNLWYFNSI